MPTSRRAPHLARLAVMLSALALGACEQASGENLERTDSPIIGGKLDTTHKAVVSLLKEVPGGYAPACSGTLIAQNLVLTAHHCVASLSSADGSVECGKTQFGALEAASSLVVSVEANVGQEGLEPFQVAEVWVPPGDDAICGRDIALLLLSKSVPASEAPPIEPALTSNLVADEVFQAVGYGLQQVTDQTGRTAGHRMMVSNARVDCNGTACGTEAVKQGEFIADSPVCSGDSGGPALDVAGRVVGITSRGDEKCTVGIYTSVSAWHDFIIQKALEASTRGSYQLPAWAGSTQSSASLAGTPPTTSGATSSGAESSGESPGVDPLGQSCSGDCPDGYACWASSGKPPGVCVPQCGAINDVCPNGYDCDTSLGVCTKTPVSPERTASCAASRAASGPSGLSALAIGLVLVGASLRHRARSS